MKRSKRLTRAALASLALAAGMTGVLNGFTVAPAQAAKTASTQSALADGETAQNSGTVGSDMDDPYWGPTNPEGFSREIPAAGSGDAFWQTPDQHFAASGGGSATENGYLHVPAIAQRERWLRNTINTEPLRWDTTSGYSSTNGAWVATRRMTEPQQVDEVVRSLSWYRVNYGGWCREAYEQVAWNRFTSTYTCLPNRTLLTSTRPDYATQKDACVTFARAARVTTPEAYEPVGMGTAPNDQIKSLNNCFDAYVTGGGKGMTWQIPSDFRSFRPDLDSDVRGCAPWERHTLSRTTWRVACHYEFYSFAGDRNRPGVQGYFPPADLRTVAPVSVSVHGAVPLNGVTPPVEPEPEPEVPVEPNPDGTYTVTSTYTVTAGRALDVTVSIARDGVAKRAPVTVTVTRWLRGKKWTFRASAAVYQTANARATRTDNRVLTLTRTGSATCTEQTYAAARACADTTARQGVEQRIEDEIVAYEAYRVQALAPVVAADATYLATRHAGQMQVQAWAVKRAQNNAAAYGLYRVCKAAYGPNARC